MSNLNTDEIKLLREIRIVSVFWIVIHALLLLVILAGLVDDLSLAASAYPIAMIVVACGLIARKNWARVIGIPAAGFMMIGFSLGTLLGGYSLYLLIKSKHVFFDHKKNMQETTSRF